VLIGGLALALGAVFLVRYSIEQGLLGPGMRIALGTLLSAALFAAGEMLRRRDRARMVAIFSRADVPAILTGAGAVAAFATIYAAYALYGLLGDKAAFLLLTAAGIVTLFLSVIHGPALAALGLLGSYATPLLVSSAEPAPIPVVLHTLAVTGAVLALARMRGWRWLAIAGVAASLGWGLLAGTIDHATTMAAELLLVMGLTALYVGLLAAGDPVSLRDRPANGVAVAALAGIAALSSYYLTLDPAFSGVASGVLIVGALGAAASRWTSLSSAALVSGAMAVLTVMLMHAPSEAGQPMMQYGAIRWTVLGGEGLARFSLTSACLALLVGIGCFLSAERAAGPAPQSAGFFAAAGAAAPLLILGVTYLRHAPFETRPEVGIAALALALVFAAATERLIAARPHDAKAPAPAFYAAGAVLALSFAASVGLATRFIPLALALGAAGVAWVSMRRPVIVLPWLAVLCAALACAALVLGPILSPEEIGTRPILNGLVLRFGLPAVAVLAAGEILRRTDDGPAAGLLQAIGLALAAFFVVLEIRHFANGGRLYAGVPGLGEQSAITLAALAFSLGLQRVARQTGSLIYRHASLVAGVAGAALIAVAHLLTANPILTGEDVGDGWFFNLLLPGYLLPALLAAAAAAAAGTSVLAGTC
jgi:uncharacterized membrane protein